MEGPRNEFNTLDLLQELFSHEEIAKWLLDQDQTVPRRPQVSNVTWCNKTVAMCESNHSRYCLIRLTEEARPLPSFLTHPFGFPDRAVCLCTGYGHAIVSYYSQQQSDPCVIISYFRLVDKQIYSEKHLVTFGPSYSSMYYPDSDHVQEIKIFLQSYSCQYCCARGSDACQCSSAIVRRSLLASVPFPRAKDPLSLFQWTWTELKPEYSIQHDPTRHFIQSKAENRVGPRSPGRRTQDALEIAMFPQDIPVARDKIIRSDDYSDPHQNEQQKHEPTGHPDESGNLLWPYLNPEQYLAPLPSSEPPHEMKLDPDFHHPWPPGVSHFSPASRSGSKGPVNPNAPESSSSSSPSPSFSSSAPNSHSQIPASSSSEQQVHQYLFEIDTMRVDPVPGLTCKYCSQSKHFRRKHDLKRHVKSVHLSDRGFHCCHCGCSFKRKCHLTFHIKAVHEKSIQLECSVCRKVYASASSLKKHIQQIHEES